jgi:hypothetical protein
MTSIFDVLLNTDDITVLGPPSQIDVSTGIGEKGIRGSQFFAGSGNPNNSGVLPVGEEVLVGDVFINNSTASEFSWLYVYTSDLTLGGATWTPVLKLQPSIYTRHIDATFNGSGIATMTVPLEDIVSDVTISDVERYVVQITPIASGPIALSINTKTIVSDNLNIVVEAVKYSSSTWSVLTGVVELGVTISVV